MNLFIENPCGEPISLTLKFEPAVKRHACCVLLVLFLSNKKSTRSFFFQKEKVDKDKINLKKGYRQTPVFYDTI